MLNNIYKEIVLNLAMLSKKGDNIDSKSVFEALKKIKEKMFQSRKQLKRPSKPCKKFLKKSSDYSTSNKYKTAKINFYKIIRSCTLVSSKHFEKIFKKISNIKYDSDAINIIQKASDQIFKKYITLLVYKLSKQDGVNDTNGAKMITSQHIDSSWEKFLDKYPKSSTEYDWVNFRKMELDKNFYDLFNIKLDDDKQSTDDVYYHFSKQTRV
jgi:hypothetical protein